MRQTDVETRVCASERTPLVRPCARAASPASGHACIRRARVRDRWQREGRFEHDLTQLDIQYSSQNDTQRTDASTRVSSHARARAFKLCLPSCAWHDPPSTSLAYQHTPRRERGTRQPPQCPPRSSYAGVRARARAIDGDSVDVSASLRSRNDRDCTRKLRRGRALSRERKHAASKALSRAPAPQFLTQRLGARLCARRQLARTGSRALLNARASGPAHERRGKLGLRAHAVCTGSKDGSKCRVHVASALADANLHGGCSCSSERPVPVRPGRVSAVSACGRRQNTNWDPRRAHSPRGVRRTRAGKAREGGQSVEHACNEALAGAR